MGDVETGVWLPMASAPRDGSRILAAIRPSEQGAAEVDVVRWGKPRRAEDACWMSTDSSHDCPIFYNGWEVAFWMPLPSWMPEMKPPGLAARLPVIPDAEADGSGI
jgi:hypothetical protein